MISSFGTSLAEFLQRRQNELVRKTSGPIHFHFSKSKKLSACPQTPGLFFVFFFFSPGQDSAQKKISFAQIRRKIMARMVQQKRRRVCGASKACGETAFGPKAQRRIKVNSDLGSCD